MLVAFTMQPALADADLPSAPAQVGERIDDNVDVVDDGAPDTAPDTASITTPTSAPDTAPDSIDAASPKGLVDNATIKEEVEGSGDQVASGNAESTPDSSSIGTETKPSSPTSAPVADTPASITTPTSAPDTAPDSAQDSTSDSTDAASPKGLVDNATIKEEVEGSGDQVASGNAESTPDSSSIGTETKPSSPTSAPVADTPASITTPTSAPDTAPDSAQDSTSDSTDADGPKGLVDNATIKEGVEGSGDQVASGDAESTPDSSSIGTEAKPSLPTSAPVADTPASITTPTSAPAADTPAPITSPDVKASNTQDLEPNKQSSVWAGKPPPDPENPALSKLYSCVFICDQRLEPIVDFWLSVFTKINSRQAFIHDARYPERIFATVDIGKPKKRFVRNTLKVWRKKLLALANTKPSSYSAQQRRLASLFINHQSGSLANEIRASTRRLRMQTGQANYFRAGIVRSGRYRQQFTTIFRSHGVPEMLVALPLIESAYNNRAVSHVGAAGMWQFMRETARRYITVNSVVDERKEPLLAANAAAKLLKNNYELSNSWPLAITGYNHGIGGMLRAKKKLATDDIYTIISRYNGRRFRFASRNFYVELLAAWEIFSNPQKYFPGIALNPEQTVNRVVMDRGYLSAQALSKLLKVDVDSLRRANPHFNKAVWSGDMYFPKNISVILPASVDARTALKALQNSSSAIWAARQKRQRFHTIRSGETLSTIATYYGIRQSDLMAVNNIRSHRIYAGRKLILPHAAALLSQAELTRLRKQLNPRVRSRGRDSKSTNQQAKTQASKKADTQIEQWLAQVENKQITSEEFIRLLNSRNGTSASPPSESTTASSQTAASTPAESSESDELRLLADPSDYEVGEDGYLASLYDETLGHYADWLGIPTQRLRNLNGLRFGRPLEVGQRLRLDFSEVDRQTFYHRRLTWHLLQQDEFFSKYQISSVIQYRAQRGDSIWKVIYRQDISPPLWLVQQLNPDINMSTLGRGQKIRLPVLKDAL